MWFPFVDDLGHTLSITTQNTRYVVHVIGLDRANQSSEDWVNTFSSTTPRLGAESTPDKCVRLYIVPSMIRPGSMPHLSRSIYTKYTSTTSWSFTTPWVKTYPKVLCYNPIYGVSLHHKGCELNMTNQGTGDQVLYVLALLNTPDHLQW